MSLNQPVNKEINLNDNSDGKFNIKRIAKKVFFIYRKGFWKFWSIYVASLLIIKGIMLGFYWIINFLQNNSFVGFTLSQSEYYMQFHDYFFGLTLDSVVNQSSLITKDLLIYFVLQILYQAFLAIPFVISMLVAKNVFDKGNEKLKKQVRDVFLIIGPVLIIGVITSILVQIGSYLWYIPGLLAMSFTSLVFPVLIDEKLKPIAVIKRSFALVKDQFLNIFGIFVLIVIAQFGVLAIAKGFAWFTVHDPAKAAKILDVYNSAVVIYSYDFVQSLIYSIVAPFTAITSYVIYREAISTRMFSASSMIESTSKFVEENRTNLTMDRQLSNAVKTETKDLIKGSYCPNCGAKLDENAVYCESCGKRI